LFYQLEGSITIITQENGERNVLELHGDMYLHPAKVPHSPSRSEGSIGLVIERKKSRAILTVYCGMRELQS
jgi:3-hydroxyanthranilate 3,4-dioxygenase